MSVASIAPAASAIAARAYAAAPQPVAVERVEIRKVASPVRDVAPLASATTAQAAEARFDCRVTGPTATVKQFDRLGMVIEGFEHLREIFEIANGFSAEEMVPAAQTGAESLDIRL